MSVRRSRSYADAVDDGAMAFADTIDPSAQMRMPDGFNEGWIAFPANGERMGMVKGAIRLADVIAGLIAGAGA